MTPLNLGYTAQGLAFYKICWFPGNHFSRLISGNGNFLDNLKYAFYKKICNVEKNVLTLTCMKTRSSHPCRTNRWSKKEKWPQMTFGPEICPQMTPIQVSLNELFLFWAFRHVFLKKNSIKNSPKNRAKIIFLLKKYFFSRPLTLLVLQIFDFSRMTPHDPSLKPSNNFINFELRILIKTHCPDIYLKSWPRDRDLKWPVAI